MIDRSSQVWIAAYAAAFVTEVTKRKTGHRPKSMRAIEQEAPQIRAFCAAVADLAAGPLPPALPSARSRL